jgi:hypothetical protein
VEMFGAAHASMLAMHRPLRKDIIVARRPWWTHAFGRVSEEIDSPKSAIVAACFCKHTGLGTVEYCRLESSTCSTSCQKARKRSGKILGNDGRTCSACFVHNDEDTRKIGKSLYPKALSGFQDMLHAHDQIFSTC